MANYTILLIDYEPRSIERFREPLVGAGYKVEIATDGLSGIETFHRLSPDMVLVEAMIPKKHGFEVCQELKRTPHGQRTPVIITTGVYKGRKYRTQALHIYGCDEYIEKPIAPQQLLGIVEKLLETSASSPRSGGPVSEPSKMLSETPVSRHGDAASDAPSMSVAPSMASEDAEGEIMARLDAILPRNENTPSSSSQPKTMALAAADKVDPFAQMKAELDAELNALPSELLFESTAEFEPTIASLPTDQAMSASVLEALPFPEFQAPVVSKPAGSPAVPDKPKVKGATNPEPKRNKNNRRSDRQSKARAASLAAVPPATTTAEPGRPYAPVVAVEPVFTVAPVVGVEPVFTAAPVVADRPAATSARSLAAAPALTVAPTRSAAVTRLAPKVPSIQEAIPTGTLVESVLEPTPTRRSTLAWVFAAVAVVAIVAGYVVLSRIGPKSPETTSPSVSVTPPVTSPAPVASEPPVANEPPVPNDPPAATAPPPATAVPLATAPSPKVPHAQESPKTTPVKSNSGPTSSIAPAPKKANERSLATPPASGAVTPPVAPTTDSGRAKPAIEAPAAVEKAAPTSIEPVSPAARVEPPAIAAPAAPAPLIPIDQADTMPVALSRRLPVFSDQAKQSGLSGTVVMNVLISERGTVDQVVLVTGVPGADVDTTALAAAKGWTYRPATKNGAPVKVWKSERINVAP
jgi:TonB family protein